MKFLPFEDAREFVRKLGLGKQKQWYQYCKSGAKPENIPSNAPLVYKKEWKGWGDWLGTGYISRQNRSYLPFEEARKYVRKLGLKNFVEWSDFCKSGKKPENIPMAANRVYKNEWRGFGDWLGTETISTRNIKYRPFYEARAFVRNLKLKNQHEWEEYCKSGIKPVDIPQKAYRTYHKNWKGFGDWLGTDFVATQKRKYQHFEEARKYVQIIDGSGESEDLLGFGNIDKNGTYVAEWTTQSKETDYNIYAIFEDENATRLRSESYTVTVKPVQQQVENLTYIPFKNPYIPIWFNDYLKD